MAKLKSRNEFLAGTKTRGKSRKKALGKRTKPKTTQRKTNAKR